MAGLFLALVRQDMKIGQVSTLGIGPVQPWEASEDQEAVRQQAAVHQQSSMLTGGILS